MNSTELAALAGLILQLLFEYLPGVEGWYGKLTPQYKRLVMLSLLILAAGGSYAAACYTPWKAVECNQAGIWQLIAAVFAAVAVNQSAHKLLKKA